MSWSKEWPNKILHVGELTKTVEVDPATLVSWPEPIDVGIDLGAGDSQTVLTTFENGILIQRIIPESELYIQEKVYNNLPPTHDPYTNPNAQIYYQCACGAILDPGTKSFAALNNCASEKGWKIRFGETGYTPYCIKCGEGVE